MVPTESTTREKQIESFQGGSDLLVTNDETDTLGSTGTWGGLETRVRERSTQCVGDCQKALWFCMQWAIAIIRG